MAYVTTSCHMHTQLYCTFLTLFLESQKSIKSDVLYSIVYYIMAHGICVYLAPPAVRLTTAHVMQVFANATKICVQVAVTTVTEAERLLFRKLPYPGIYHCVARYGYGDQVQMGVPFVTRLLDKVSMLCGAVLCCAVLCCGVPCCTSQH